MNVIAIKLDILKVEGALKFEWKNQGLLISIGDTEKINYEYE